MAYHVLFGADLLHLLLTVDTFPGNRTTRILEWYKSLEVVADFPAEIKPTVANRIEIFLVDPHKVWHVSLV
jgi:hypothetical protein